MGDFAAATQRRWNSRRDQQQAELRAVGLRE